MNSIGHFDKQHLSPTSYYIICLACCRVIQGLLISLSKESLAKSEILSCVRLSNTAEGLGIQVLSQLLRKRGRVVLHPPVTRLLERSMTVASTTP